MDSFDSEVVSLFIQPHTSYVNFKEADTTLPIVDSDEHTQSLLQWTELLIGQEGCVRRKSLSIEKSMITLA